MLVAKIRKTWLPPVLITASASVWPGLLHDALSYLAEMLTEPQGPSFSAFISEDASGEPETGSHYDFHGPRHFWGLSSIKYIL